MPGLPKPSRLNLSDARIYIGKCVGISANDSQVIASYCDALCTGALPVYADFYPAPDVKRGHYTSNQKVPTAVFKQFGKHLFNAMFDDLLPADISQSTYNRPFYQCFTIATADIDAWIASSSTENEPRTKEDNPIPSSTPNQPYVTAVEAIIWIAYKKWLTYPALFEQCGKEDIFYRSQFSSMGSRDRGTDHNSYPYDIGKDEMFIFAGHLAEQKTWTEETWRKARRGAIQDMDTMQKCLDTERNKHGFTLPEFVERLKISIAYDDEQSQKLHNATQELLNAARDKKLAIRGKRKNGNGDIEDIPLGFLDRLDYKIDLWGNKISPSPQARWNAETLQQVKQIEVLGWHELRVKRENVVRLWSEKPERDYFNELKYAPEMAAAKELKARKDKAFDTLPAPDWREWGNIPMLPLWKAVALSLNVDPTTLEVHGVFDPDFHGGLSDEFKMRLRVTIANQDALGIYTGMMRGHFHPSSYYMPVEVTRFFKWAVGIGWKLPISFPKGVSDDPAGIVSDPPSTEETLGTGEKQANHKNNRGRKPVKTNEIRNKILEALRSGEISVDSLLSEKQENLAAQYCASREIVTKARDNAILEYKSNREIVGID